MRLRFLILMLLASLAAAQNGNNPSVNSLTFPVFTLNPDPVPGASLAVIGQPGQATWYFWASANFQLGSVISYLGSVQNAPNTLSSGNYISIIPSAYPAGVSTVDILATTTQLSPTGVCNCAVATGLTSGGTNFQSNSLSSYTVSVLNPQAFNLRLTNEVTGTGATSLVLRNAYTGALVCNLSTGCGSGSCIVGSSNKQVLFNDNGACAGNALLVFDKTGGIPTLNLGLTQSAVDPDIQIPGTFTSASNASGTTGTPAISGLTQGDGSLLMRGLFGGAKIAHGVANTHFEAGVEGVCAVQDDTSAPNSRCIGVLGVTQADAGAGTYLNISAFTAFGPQTATGSHVQVATGLNEELNFGVFNGTIDHLIGVEVNGPTSAYSSGDYKAFYADSSSSGEGTTAYGFFVEPLGFGRTQDYGLYVSDSKSYLGNTLRIGPAAFSALPSCVSGLEGTMRPVTDSTTATWGATITGTGTHHVLAYCDGTNWTVAAA